MHQNTMHWHYRPSLIKKYRKQSSEVYLPNTVVLWNILAQPDFNVQLRIKNKVFARWRHELIIRHKTIEPSCSRMDYWSLSDEYWLNNRIVLAVQCKCMASYGMLVTLTLWAQAGLPGLIAPMSWVRWQNLFFSDLLSNYACNFWTVWDNHAKFGIQIQYKPRIRPDLEIFSFFRNPRWRMAAILDLFKSL